MISIENMSAKYGKETVLRNISCTFREREISAIVGGDGAGKTTLLKALAGQLTTSAQYQAPPKKCIGLALGNVWTTLSVQENLDFVACVWSLPSEKYATRSDHLLELAGLSGFRSRIAGHLSGGMRQKLAVIMAMLPQPQLLLLDEPTTGVDPASRQDLWQIIRAAAGEGATVVISTTYLDEAERADSVVFLDNGTVRSAGTPTQIVAAIPGTIWSQPQQDPPQEYSWPRGPVRHMWVPPGDAAPSTGARIQPDLEDSAIAFLLDHRRVSIANAAFHQKETQAQQTLVDLHEVTKVYGDFRAVDSVSFAIQTGKIVGLVGGNGAGKTTLIKMILGIESPTDGQALLLNATASRSARHDIGYVGQNGGLIPNLTARENLEFAAQIYGRKVPDKAIQKIASMHNVAVKRLPLGQRRLLAYICATLHNPSLLVLDEPTSGMDPLSRAILWHELRETADNGTGILVTTHYMQEAQQADTLIVLAKGAIQTQGAPSVVLHSLTG